MLKHHVVVLKAAEPQSVNITVEAKISASRQAGETRSREERSRCDVTVLCVPKPVGENPVRKFPVTRPSFEATATNVPLGFPSHKEKRELGRTKITEITALNARLQ
jgi:hypothetical protein